MTLRECAHRGSPSLMTRRTFLCGRPEWCRSLVGTYSNRVTTIELTAAPPPLHPSSPPTGYGSLMWPLCGHLPWSRDALGVSRHLLVSEGSMAALTRARQPPSLESLVRHEPRQQSSIPHPTVDSAARKKRPDDGSLPRGREIPLESPIRAMQAATQQTSRGPQS